MIINAVIWNYIYCYNLNYVSVYIYIYIYILFLINKYKFLNKLSYTYYIIHTIVTIL